MWYGIAMFKCIKCQFTVRPEVDTRFHTTTTLVPGALKCAEPNGTPSPRQHWNPSVAAGRSWVPSLQWWDSVPRTRSADSLAAHRSSTRRRFHNREVHVLTEVLHKMQPLPGN